MKNVRANLANESLLAKLYLQGAVALVLVTSQHLHGLDPDD